MGTIRSTADRMASRMASRLVRVSATANAVRAGMLAYLLALVGLGAIEVLGSVVKIVVRFGASLLLVLRGTHLACEHGSWLLAEG